METNKNGIICAYFVYCAIFFSFSWPAFQNVLLSFEGAWIIHMGFGVLVYILILFVDKSTFLNLFKSPLIFWLLWIIYNLINSHYKGITQKSLLLLISYSVIFISLTCFAFKYDRKKTHNILIISNIFLVFVFSFSSKLTDLGGPSLRLAGEKVNSNDLGVYSSMAAYFILLKYVYKDLSLKKAIIFSLPFFVIPILCGSRTAYSICLIPITMVVLCSIETIRITVILKYLLLVGVLLFLNYIVLSNSGLGERFQNRENESRLLGTYSDSIITKIMGERAIYYYDGYELFKEHPITGVGYRNYSLYNFRDDHVCHVEYMAELSEGGVIGFSLFIIFFLSIISILIHTFKTNKKIAISGLAAVGMLLISSLGSVFTLHFPLYGLISFAIYACFMEKERCLSNNSCEKVFCKERFD